MEYLDAHAVIAAEIALDGRTHGPQPHVAGRDQRRRGVVGSHVDQGARANVWICSQTRLHAHQVAQLLDVSHHGGVGGVAVVRALLQRLRFQGSPFGLEGLPALRRAQALAQLAVHLVHCRRALVDFRLLGDHFALARRVAVEEGESKGVVRDDLACEQTERIQIVSPVSLETGLTDLLGRGADIEPPDECGGHGHRHHQECQLLPESQAA